MSYLSTWEGPYDIHVPVSSVQQNVGFPGFQFGGPTVFLPLPIPLLQLRNLG